MVLLSKLKRNLISPRLRQRSRESILNFNIERDKSLQKDKLCVPGIIQEEPEKTVVRIVHTDA